MTTKTKRPLSEIAEEVGCPWGQDLAVMLYQKKRAKVTGSKIHGDLAAATGYKASSIRQYLYDLQLNPKNTVIGDEYQHLFREIANYFAGRTVARLRRPIAEWCQLAGLEYGEAFRARLNSAGLSIRDIAIEMVEPGRTLVESFTEMEANAARLYEVEQNPTRTGGVHWAQWVETIKRTIALHEAVNQIERDGKVPDNA